MASLYPGALDSFTNPASTDNLNTTGVLHDVQHSDLNNAVRAIEVELGVDPSGAFATVAAAVAALLNPSKVKAVRATNQTVANNTNTVVAFTSEAFDTDGWHDNTTNNSRLTCPTGKGGTYLVVGVFDFAYNPNGIRSIALRVNGVNAIEIVASAVGAHQGMQVVGSFSLVPTDYIELSAYQAAGGNLDLDVTYTNPSLTAVYLGP